MGKSLGKSVAASGIKTEKKTLGKSASGGAIMKDKLIAAEMIKETGVGYNPTNFIINKNAILKNATIYKSAEQTENKVKNTKGIKGFLTSFADDYIKKDAPLATTPYGETPAELLKKQQGNPIPHKNPTFAKSSNNPLEVTSKSGTVYDYSMDNVPISQRLLIESASKKVSENRLLDLSREEKTTLTAIANDISAKYGSDIFKGFNGKDNVDMLDALWWLTGAYQRTGSQSQAVYEGNKAASVNRLKTEYAVLNSKDFEEKSDSGYRNGSSDKLYHRIKSGDDVYKYMNNTEKAVYYYFIGAGKTDAADNYISSLKGDLQSRMASADAKENNNVENFADAIGTGFNTGAYNLGRSISGIKASANQSLNMIDKEVFKTTYDEKLWSEIKANTEDRSLVYNLLLDTANNTAAQVPAMLVGSLSGQVGYFITMSAGIVGANTTEAINSGYEAQQGFIHGLVESALEIGGEKALGGFSSLLKGGKNSSIIKSAIEAVDNAVKNKFVANALAKTITFIGQANAEGVEEFLQELLGPLVRNVIYGENNKYTAETFKNAIYAYAVGALSGGLMSAPYISRSVKNTRYEITGDAIKGNSKNTAIDTKQIVREAGGVKAVLALAEVAGNKSQLYQTIKEQYNSGIEIDSTDLGALYEESFSKFKEPNKTMLENYAAKNVDAVIAEAKKENEGVTTEQQNIALNNGNTGDIIETNKDYSIRSEDNESTDTELLERGTVSTADRGGNSIRQQGGNSEKLAARLEVSQVGNRTNDKGIRAGESGWINKIAESQRQTSEGFVQSIVGKIRGVNLNGKDTANRNVSANIKEKFKDTVFKDENGNLISLYHWTTAVFDMFAKGEFGFHFGTLDAAQDRYEQTKENEPSTPIGNYKEVYLNIKNPIEMQDGAGEWTAHWVALQLAEKGIISEHQYELLEMTTGFDDKTYDNAAANAVRNILKENGYDGIIYKNDSEDAGSYSVIALYPDQILTVAENGVLKEGIDVTESSVASSNTDYELSDNDQYAKDKSFWIAENKNDTTVSKSLKDKLAGLFGKGSENKTVSIGEIVKLIEKEFNVPISKGKFREKAYGIYKNHSEAIRTKISNALPTIAHELGHHLDKKYNLRGFESIGEAERILKETRPNFYNAYKPQARPREAVAEFIRDYLADRKMAKEKYPFFFEEFERRLSEVGATDLENIKAIGDKINQYYTADLRDRAKSAILSRKEAKKINRIGLRIDDMLTRAETELLDDGAAFKEISNEAYNLYYWAKKSSVRAKNTLTGYYMAGFNEDIVKQRDKDGNIMKDENGKDIYVPALKYVLSEIETGTMFDDFNEYLVYRHGIEWLKQDLRVFADDAINNEKYMAEKVKELENKYPQFKETAENLYDWYRTFVYEYGVKSGLMTKEQYKTLSEKYPCYVPFMRNVEAKKKGFAKSGVSNQNAPIKKAKGSGLEIYTPIESLAIKVEQFMKAADRNAVMQKIADTVDQEDGFGWLLEEVPPDMIPNTISSQLIKDKAKKTIRDSGLDDSTADDFSTLIDELIGESITDFKISPIQGENVVAVRRNGKRTLYQVHDKNMLAAVTGLGPEQFGVITKSFGKATRIFKALTTGSNAVWSLVSNAPRDFDSAYKYGSENNPIKYTVDYIKAVLSQFNKNDETMKLYRTLGGGYNNSFANAGELQLTVKEMLPKDKNFVERVKSWFDIVNSINKLADFVETAPRLAEFKRVYERTGDAKKAMLSAEEVTVNFNRSGKFTKTLDQYIPYLNASLQANAKYAKTIAQAFSKEGDKSFLVKSIITALLKTGLMFGILGLYGDEGKEEYEKLSAYKKNNFYNIYLGNGRFFSISKSQSTGVFDSLLERTFEIAYKEDVEWAQEVKDFAGYMWLTFGPPFVDDMIIGSTVYDLAKNENFSGSPIVPSYYEDLVPEMQYNEKTTYIAKAIGKLFGWSPMKIDHIIESNLGVFGLINKSLGRAEKDWSLGIITKVVTDNAYSTDILNNFYDKADDYASKAKSYPDNAEYVYKDKQYTAIKSIVSALNEYGKESPELAREYKILARDYVDRFEKESETNKKLYKLLDETKNDDILYDKTFKPTYSINKVEYKMTSEEFMEMIDLYYEEIEKEYEEILDMNLSNETTERMLVKAKENTYNRISKKYKKKR